ncbi:MAG: STAS domain-containing protein [Candidatus Kapabacteria bacterium]|nr:STAS domain-containing protein [Ignavibacteriota bacterium]MCW5883745.1 STAS domain-containing protein [Candidatus Kapabacteria bacterium]
MKNIQVEVLDTYTIMRLSGQYTGGTETDDLVVQFEKVLAQNQPRLVVDFENTSYLSSILIGILVRMHAKFSEKDGLLIFCSLNTTLRNVLKMTKVDTVLYITNTFDEAIERITR